MRERIDEIYAEHTGRPTEEVRHGHGARPLLLRRAGARVRPDRPRARRATESRRERMSAADVDGESASTLAAAIARPHRAGGRGQLPAVGARCRASRSPRSRSPGWRGSCRSRPSSSASASARASPGMLQSTLGNLPELFVVIFALQKGELVVAQTAIVGSILANALLVLGLVIVVGARRAPDGVMRFSTRLPRDTATLLQVTVFIIVLLGLSLAAHDPASHHVKAISVVGARVPAGRLLALGGALPALRRRPGGTRRTPDRAARRSAPPARGCSAVHARAAARRRRGVGVRLGLVRQRARSRRSPSSTSPRPSRAS